MDGQLGSWELGLKFARFVLNLAVTYLRAGHFEVLDFPF